MRSPYRKDAKPKSRIKITYIFLIAILTMAIFFYFYMLSAKSDRGFDIDALFTGSSSAGSAAEGLTTLPETTTTAPPAPALVNPVPESSAQDSVYFDTCAFVGDSITTGLSGYAFLPETRVLAGKGMNIDKINSATIVTATGEKTIFDALIELQPKNVYIMLGSNGIAWLSNQKMIEEYGAFIDEIKSGLPDSSVYILSIPPVSAKKETDPNSAILNTDIDAYNSELLAMANSKELYFVDINTALKGNDGKLPAEWSAGDGMHFKKDTYSVMLDYILKHTVRES